MRQDGRIASMAAVIAGGLSNGEVADRPVLSEDTVGNYVAHILRKLGLRSRAEIAVRAVERGRYRSGDEAEEG